MKRILFITNRNILTTCGELRLIKNRAESLYNDYKIVSDFLVFQKKERINSEKQEKIDSGGNIKVVGYSFKQPLSILTGTINFKREIKKRISSERYDAIVFSGIGMASYLTLVKDCPRYKIVDIHGSSEDILELSKEAQFPRNIFLKSLYAKDVNCFKHNLKYADGFFVVTKALEKYVRNKYELKDQPDFYIVPCATNELSLKEEEITAYRKKYRDKYGIDENEIVFVYSGGISAWQCVNETVDLYKKIANQIRYKTRLVVYSHNIEQIKKTAGTNFNGMIADSYDAAELKYALTIGDYAFMLRKDCVTNNVAFPNKFLEYIQSGMKIIGTPYVHDIAQQIQKENAGYLYDFNDDISALISYIETNKQQRNTVDTVDRILIDNGFKNRLKLLDQKLSGDQHE